MTNPIVDRPIMPEGYGVESATEVVAWETVVVKLTESKNYWLATTRPDGRPHVVPRWGVWVDDMFWYDGSPDTLHVRNLSGDDRCSLHLESGSDVVIVEGRSIQARPIKGELGVRLAAEYARKYAPEYTPAAEQWSDEIAGGMRCLAPNKAIAWSEFPKDLTRFTFPS